MAFPRMIRGVSRTIALIVPIGIAATNHPTSIKTHSISEPELDHNLFYVFLKLVLAAELSLSYNLLDQSHNVKLTL